MSGLPCIYLIDFRDFHGFPGFHGGPCFSGGYPHCRSPYIPNISLIYPIIPAFFLGSFSWNRLFYDCLIRPGGCHPWSLERLLGCQHLRQQGQRHGSCGYSPGGVTLGRGECLDGSVTLWTPRCAGSFGKLEDIFLLGVSCGRRTENWFLCGLWGELAFSCLTVEDLDGSRAFFLMGGGSIAP